MILIVDDEPGILQLCERLLGKAGYPTLTASTPNQAVEILSHEPVSLLLADIRMPGMNGFQLMEIARNHHPDLTIILMTGYGTVDVAIEALRHGADSLILKPFEGAELLQSVEKAILDHQRRLDSVRLRILRPLFDTTKLFFSETNQDKLWKLALVVLCENLSCNIAGVLQPTEGNFQLIESRGQTLTPETIRQLSEIRELESNGQEGIKINIRRNVPEYPHSLIQALTQNSIQSLLIAPVNFKGNKFLLLTTRNESQSPFQEADLEMLVILARQVAAAMENARLYTELSASLASLEKSQKALIQAEKLAAAGRLTASIAHEINNPLQSLSSCLDLAGRSELPIDVRQKYLEVAQKELERLMITVQHMLDLYRPKAREKQWINLIEIIDHVLTLFESQLREHQIQVHTHYAESIPGLLAIKDQIQQVILNLLLNSVEAMPGGGEIFIEASGNKDNVEVIIEDTGSGISDAERSRIFEPFVSTKPNGTGLGLAVSYGIVQAHGGSLELLTNHGRGARFRIVLPTGGGL